MRIGDAIKYLRFQDKLGLREQARKIGVSAATLSRIERGESCDMESFVKLLAWLFS